ncbi:MAG: class I SAM-dependent RNA methyltransferase [Christensenella sp.]|uniref:THUMP domain-containing class I SAM-dependent RNA methyltransferase n=1 Tax=Christensenella sp. TaxID=1935934 RepID=UPI002B21A3C2|nr:class I SAM-dependent RNA methyltransferase [Christensenella sp.]MEA5002838.1 class I SAM-dependent RNA methyltransferase [Christensenella sp.]
MNYRCYASCAFGMEGILANELRDFGFENVSTQDARVYFDADMQGVAKANVFLRTADRIYWVLKEFKAVSFEQLFEGVTSIPFGDILPSDARFPVDGNAVHSALGSVSDVQSVAKKAVVRAMQRVYKQERFPENGNVFNLYVNILKDQVTVALNTSGAGLNRRGYRLKNAQAPLKETLAASLIMISQWRTRDFYDPLCGSGTIAIEAAMMASRMAPGIKRRFDAQSYDNDFKKAFQLERDYAKSLVTEPQMQIFASDIDRKSLDLAREHAHNMDVAQWIRFDRKDVKDFEQPERAASIITNPPYAVRMGEEKEVATLYRNMGKTFLPLEDTLVFVITADEQFENKYGAKADKRRKLYNGNIKCTYYQYFRKKR